MRPPVALRPWLSLVASLVLFAVPPVAGGDDDKRQDPPAPAAPGTGDGKAADDRKDAEEKKAADDKKAAEDRKAEDEKKYAGRSKAGREKKSARKGREAPDPGAAPAAGGPPTEEVSIRGEPFRLELAIDAGSRKKGLSGRDKVEDHGGMIFIFPSPAHQSFWMRDCLVDIDAAFLDERGRVVALHEMKVERPRGRFEPSLAYERRLTSYPSRKRAQFAIELKAGTIQRLGLKEGETITLDLDRLKKLAK